MTIPDCLTVYHPIFIVLGVVGSWYTLYNLFFFLNNCKLKETSTMEPNWIRKAGQKGDKYQGNYVDYIYFDERRHLQGRGTFGSCVVGPVCLANEATDALAKCSISNGARQDRDQFFASVFWFTSCFNMVHFCSDSASVLL